LSHVLHCIYHASWRVIQITGTHYSYVVNYTHSSVNSMTKIWAVRDRIGSRLALEQAYRFVFPLYRSLREAFVWSLAAPGRSERRGRCPEFSLWVSIFMLGSSLLNFTTATSGFFPAVRDQGQDAPAIVYQIREGYADIRGMLSGKVLVFVLILSKLKFRLCSRQPPTSAWPSSREG